jgi:hypothetical protein
MPTAPPIAAPIATPIAAPIATPIASLGPELAPLRPLLGTWQGADAARHTTGEFTLAPELGGHALLRRNVDETPQGRHEDLMMIYSSPAGLRATYVDNEGHAIAYAVATDGHQIEFISDEVAGQPRFKLTYDVRGPDELDIDFAIAMPGQPAFQHYTGGVVHRVHDR